jgi:hypothetical protein
MPNIVWVIRGTARDEFITEEDSYSVKTVYYGKRVRFTHECFFEDIDQAIKFNKHQEANDQSIILITNGELNHNNVIKIEVVELRIKEPHN